MNFSVPTNWDDNLLLKVDKTYIEDFYGKLESDFFGGTKPSYALPSVTRKKASKHIKMVHDFKIKFNYLLNTSCLGNQEWTRSGQKKMNKMLSWLVDNKVEKVTVAIPYLAELIKKRFPDLKIVVSEIAGVGSLDRVKLWENLGADEILFSFIQGSRNFELLKSIRNNTKLKLKLTANLLCLRGCPFSKYHSVNGSHASQDGFKWGRFSIDYCSARCRLIRFKHPWQIIRSGWIRPEDLKYYENIGVDSIKFVDRSMKTEFLERIVGAYTKGTYNGNLMDLFFTPDKSLVFNRNGGFLRKIKYFFHPGKINLFKLYESRKLLQGLDIKLDNQKLDGFLEYYLKADSSACLDDENYCKEIAQKALSFDNGARINQIKNLEKFLDSLNSGDIFF